ncbi:hypothetical protein GOV04_03290 [Candidatus Woesearchaeota archaeon]|nr:hypothetical protein [Candidatus Woesearchaeota archaeon]
MTTTKKSVKNISFEDVIIIIALIGVTTALILGMQMSYHLSSGEYDYTETKPGDKIKSAHVHLLGDSTIVIFMAFLFKKRTMRGLGQIKQLGFFLLVLGMIFHPAGLALGLGYDIEFFRKFLSPAEYTFIGGMIILIISFLISKNTECC